MLSADHSLSCQGSKTFLEGGSEQWALGLPSGVGDRVPSIPLLKDSEVSVSPKGARSEYWRRGQSNKVLRLWWRGCWEDLQKNKASSPLMSATWRGVPFQPLFIQHQEDSETTIELRIPVLPAELHLYYSVQADTTLEWNKRSNRAFNICCGYLTRNWIP